MSGIGLEDRIRLTQALQQWKEFIFFETCRVSGENNHSFLFTNPRSWISCGVHDDVDTFLSQLDVFQQQGFFLAGWFDYEFGYLLEPSLRKFMTAQRPQKVLAHLGIFESPLVFEHQAGQFSGQVEWPRALDAGQSVSIKNLQTSISRQEFLADIGKIHQYIRAGDVYQVNYTFMLDFSVTGSAAALYRQLCKNQSVSYTAWLRYQGRDIMSFSPELFFRAEGPTIMVRPMKGTLSRGRNLDEDRRRSTRLFRDEKSRSENVMIVDLLRNDLARLLHRIGGGKVRVRSLFDVEAYESLLQMTSTIEGHAGSSAIMLTDVLPSLFPCGSVTGAPKIRAMEIIQELERESRGVYCGAIGYCGPESMCFNVPIRTLTLEKGKGRMGVGAGIISDSDPKAEWRECLLKAHFLTKQRPDFQLIETLCWQPEKGFLLFREHMERLAASAGYFFFCLDIDNARRKLDEAAMRFADDAMRVRLLLTKEGECKITSHPLPASPVPVGSLPAVSFSREWVDPADIFLYHKTTHRPLYTQERQRAEKDGLFDILFMNTRGEVTEGTITSIFVKKDGRLYTPPLSCGLLPGTLRRNYLESGKATEKIILEDEIKNADKLYLANSVRGLVRVRLVDRGEK